jgi:predicted RNase H-like HicB family nuclease
MIEIEFDAIIFREDGIYVAYCPELDVSSCGDDVGQAKENFRTAVRLFVEEAEKMGTLTDILQEAGYQKGSSG